VRWSTNEIDAKALDAVTERIDTAAAGKGGDSQAIVVFNPLGWARSGEVTVRLRGYPGRSPYVIRAAEKCTEQCSCEGRSGWC